MAPRIALQSATPHEMDADAHEILRDRHARDAQQGRCGSTISGSSSLVRRQRDDSTLQDGHGPLICGSSMRNSRK